VNLVFLGRLREIAAPSLTPPSDVRTLGELKDWLTRTEPALAEALVNGRVQYAVNQSLVRDLGHPLGESDEIAFLPPMSGG
jgi:molybdopterin converting factor small subunit